MKRYNENTEITANTSGYTSSITLEPGLWNLFVTSTSWASGSCDLQVSADNVIFFDATENDTVVSFTENAVKEINGGLILRLDVSGNVSGVYLVAKKSNEYL